MLGAPGFRNALVAALVLGASGCENYAPSSHAGFRVGMSQEQAFELACDKMNRNELLLGPTLYIEGTRRPVNRFESICALRQEALSAEQWWLVEPGFREKYIVIDFAGDEVVRLQIKWRGWIP